MMIGEEVKAVELARTGALPSGVAVCASDLEPAKEVVHSLCWHL
jgi:hypothetical protein